VFLRQKRKRAERATGVIRSATGRSFQAVSPATEKAQRCWITVRSSGDQQLRLGRRVQWVSV